MRQPHLELQASFTADLNRYVSASCTATGSLVGYICSFFRTRLSSILLSISIATRLIDASDRSNDSSPSILSIHAQTTKTSPAYQPFPHMKLELTISTLATAALTSPTSPSHPTSTHHGTALTITPGRNPRPASYVKPSDRSQQAFSYKPSSCCGDHFVVHLHS